MRFIAKIYKTSDVSVAITIPKEITDKLKIKAGDIEEFKIYKGETELPKWMTAKQKEDWEKIKCKNCGHGMIKTRDNIPLHQSSKITFMGKETFTIAKCIVFDEKIGKRCGCTNPEPETKINS